MVLLETDRSSSSTNLLLIRVATPPMGDENGSGVIRDEVDSKSIDATGQYGGGTARQDPRSRRAGRSSGGAISRSGPRGGRITTQYSSAPFQVARGEARQSMYSYFVRVRPWIRRDVRVISRIAGDDPGDRAPRPAAPGAAENPDYRGLRSLAESLLSPSPHAPTLRRPSCSAPATRWHVAHRDRRPRRRAGMYDDGSDSR
jgi:hypothetical protein